MDHLFGFPIVVNDELRSDGPPVLGDFADLMEFVIAVQSDPVYVWMGIRDAENYANQADG